MLLALEYCKECENARKVYDVLGNYFGTSIICLCPLKKKGRCACEDAQQIADRMAGVTE